MRKPRFVAALFVLAGAVAGCAPRAEQGPAVVRIGYFANLTHAPAIVAADLGFFREALGPSVKVDLHVLNAGPEAVEALFSGALDVSYIGPSPAINAFAQSKGEAIRIVAGATSGGAALVVQPKITTAAQLKGTTLATPQLGNTQDVALRAWLKKQGLAASLEGGGDVSILPQANAQTLETFRSGAIQGGWVPEPWATRMVIDGGGKILVDERTLWPNGQFVTTHVIVRTAFLRDHPDLLKKVLEAHVRAVDYLLAEPAKARDVVNAGIGRLMGKPLAPRVIETAWPTFTFTLDPLGATLRRSADDATAVGLLEPVVLAGIYDLGPLNGILAAAGRSPVTP